MHKDKLKRSETYSEMRQGLRLRLKNNPLFYPVYVIATQSRDPGVTVSTRICAPWKDLLLDGYQRSANSFSFNLVRRFYPQLRIVHHTHSVATLKAALLFNTPSIILIRKPIDAIVSDLIMYQRPDIGYSVESYISYYEFVQKRMDRFRLITFDTVTHRPDVLLQLVSECTGAAPVDLNGVDMQQEVQAVFDELERHTQAVAKGEAFRRRPIPDEQRSQMKECLKKTVAESPRLPDADLLYEQLCAQAVIPQEQPQQELSHG